MIKRKKRIIAGILRRLSQSVFVCLFLFLFVKTDYSGSDQLEYAVNILFRLDPLLAASAMLAAKVLIGLMLPSLVLVVLSLFLGRSFCGWVCPMGGLIDLSHSILYPKGGAKQTFFPRMPYVLLTFVLVAAIFQVGLVGYIDPFSILVRGLALAFYPALNYGTDAFFTLTYHQAPEIVNSVTEPIYAALQASILPSEQKTFTLAYFSAAVLLGVFLLELWQRRYFCRNICPLGGLLGLLAGIGMFHGHGGGKACGKCRQCQSVCRMGAIDEKRLISRQTCILCLECQEQCPRSMITFVFCKPARRVQPVSLSRRQFVGALAGGAAMPVLAGVRPLEYRTASSVIRPPGALIEKEFLARCVRCGECMQVCIGNALQPAFLQAGIEGVFSPIVVARTGYCEYNCRLCGQVCPTGALRALQLTEKHRFKIGSVYFDKSRCLPFAKGVPCIVCEEHCPTPEKAISFKEAVMINEKGMSVTIKQPYVIDNLCIGCGICENKCPLPGRSAVLLTREGETRNPENRGNFLQGYGSSGY